MTAFRVGKANNKRLGSSIQKKIADGKSERALLPQSPETPFEIGEVVDHDGRFKRPAPGPADECCDRSRHSADRVNAAELLFDVNARETGWRRHYDRLTGTRLFAGWYFQWRDFPSESHLIEVASLSWRVSSRLASVIHSRYSRRWLGERLSKVFPAFAFFFRAAAK